MKLFILAAVACVLVAAQACGGSGVRAGVSDPLAVELKATLCCVKASKCGRSFCGRHAELVRRLKAENIDDAKRRNPGDAKARLEGEVVAHQNDKDDDGDAAALMELKDSADNPRFNKLWPGGVVYMRSVSGKKRLTTRAVLVFGEVVQEYHKHTCLRFKIDKNPFGRTAKLEMRESGSSWCGRGYRTTKCVISGTMLKVYDQIHEVGHLIGMDHTFKRHDRDKYLDLDNKKCRRYYKRYCKESEGKKFFLTNWFCVRHWMGQFSKSKAKRSVGSFDFDSIMMYPLPLLCNSTVRAEHASGVNQGMIGFHNELSSEDVSIINSMYGCVYLTGEYEHQTAKTKYAFKLHVNLDMRVSEFVDVIEEQTGLEPDEQVVRLRIGANKVRMLDLKSKSVLKSTLRKLGVTPSTRVLVKPHMTLEMIDQVMDKKGAFHVRLPHSEFGNVTCQGTVGSTSKDVPHDTDVDFGQHEKPFRLTLQCGGAKKEIVVGVDEAQRDHKWQNGDIRVRSSRLSRPLRFWWKFVPFWNDSLKRIDFGQSSSSSSSSRSSSSSSSSSSRSSSSSSS